MLTPKSHDFSLFNGFLVLYVQRRLYRNFFKESFDMKRLDLHSVYLSRAHFTGETLPNFLESIYGWISIIRDSRFGLFDWFLSQFCKGDSAGFLSEIELLFGGIEAYVRLIY